jgi:hypothetical protein
MAIVGSNGGSAHRGRGAWMVVLQRMFLGALFVTATVPFLFQQPSSLSSILSTSDLVFTDLSSDVTASNSTERPGSTGSSRCAINFWGLPRAFSELVLPSIVENVIKVNAPYKCDYFVHYFDITEEGAGRSGSGGVVNASEVLLLEREVKKVDSDAFVQFTSTTDEEFLQIYGDLLNKIRTTIDPVTNRYKYFPWKAVTYKFPATTDNIIRMWHTIQSAFQLMDEHGQRQQTSQPYYSRVAMLRSDVFYLTPVDIYSLDDRSPPDVTPSLLQQEIQQQKKLAQDQHRSKDKGKMDTTSVVELIPRPMDSLSKNSMASGVWQDVNNEYGVLPGFGRHPVSDRMIYGPYAAVKLWSTQRFSRLENNTAIAPPGWALHSEKFINRTILSAIQDELNVPIVEHPTICFLRARPDESIWMNDCDGATEVSKPSVRNSYRIRASQVAKLQKQQHFGSGQRHSTENSVKVLIEHILQRPCTGGTTRIRQGVFALHCSVK